MIKYTFQHLPTTTSTMDVAWEWIQTHDTPLLVLADEQTKGRGKPGRDWISPRGNLHATFAFPVNRSLSESAQLTFVAAISVGEAILSYEPFADLKYKWPNDVLVNHQKISGLLLEAHVHKNTSWIFVGFGVNLLNLVNINSISLFDIIEKKIHSLSFLKKMMNIFQNYYILWEEVGFEPIRQAWMTRSLPLGSPLKIKLFDSSIDGCFCGIDQTGALILDIDGVHQRFLTGDVFYKKGRR